MTTIQCGFGFLFFGKKITYSHWGSFEVVSIGFFIFSPESCLACLLNLIKLSNILVQFSKKILVINI